MQSVLPKNLNYSEVKPVGFPSHVRQEKFTPVAFNTSNSGVGQGDVIRFNISTNGFWDPYSCYIKLEVDVSGSDGNKVLVDSTKAAGSLQIDNSASSFISQLILYKGGTEIERIEEYDTLAAILNDMNSSTDSRLTRYGEGMFSQNSSGSTNYQNDYYQDSSAALKGFSPLLLLQPQTSQADLLKQYVGTTVNNTTIQRYEFTLAQIDGKDSVQLPSQTTVLKNNQATGANVATSGYQTPYCQSLSAFGNEALLSTNFYNTCMYKGNMSQNIIADRQTFCIPLLSGLLGVLMPKDSYKYIPMKALNELIIEFRLNPYAMFTSGYADGATNANSTTGNGILQLNTTTNPMLQRIWRITKFELNVEMQYFEPQVEDIILSQLRTEKGIVLHSQSWMLGPRYQIGAGSTPTGTYQVNLGFESLKNIMFCFLPDDFVTYSFCRKQYRISANITSMYLKIGSEYFPPLPITGHAGNPGGYQSVNNEYDQSNVEFLIQLYKAFGKFHDTNSNCIVNPVNFAVNQRAYNPTNISALSNGTVYTNLDTAVSQSLFHENRCVGRAVYAMNLETLNQDYSVISGINTLKNSPFDITLKSDNNNAYQRNYQMYVFCQYDMLIQLKSTGIQILGRG